MKKSSLFHLRPTAAWDYACLLSLLPILMLVIANGEMGNDEGIWSYIGRIWIDQGIPPYRGAVENKTPGIFLLFTVAQAVWGLQVYFVRMIGVLAVCCSAGLIYCIGRELCDRRAGLLAMLVFGLSMGWSLTDGPYAAQTETFMVLFSVLAFYGLFRAVDISCGSLHSNANPMSAVPRAVTSSHFFWLAVAGFSIGLSIAFKQIAVTTAGAMMLSFFVLMCAKGSGACSTGSLIGGIATIVMGVVVATALSVVPLLFSGVSLGEYIDGAWLILANAGSSPVGIFSRIHRMLQVFTNSKMTLFYPFIIIFLILNPMRTKPTAACLLIWLICDFIGVNGSGAYFGHQLRQLLPVLSLICGISMSQIELRVANDDSGRLFKKMAITAALYLMFFPYSSCSQNLYRLKFGFHDPKVELGYWLRDHTEPGDYVYVHGTVCDVVTSCSGRLSSSRYFNNVFVSDDAAQSQRLHDLSNHPPRYFLHQQPGIEFDANLKYYLEQHYQLERIDNGFAIYRRL
ncbi:MAG: glycosyltransferase family 39 protein [Planctomycetota bacterium]|nr:glycosyltransferase family 39 protein [Planctomycetota bacterium]MDA1211934.1 glycosyltransferase family 39 protein [Planctomycetota bacterium]